MTLKIAPKKKPAAAIASAPKTVDEVKAEIAAELEAGKNISGKQIRSRIAAAKRKLARNPPVNENLAMRKHAAKYHEWQAREFFRPVIQEEFARIGRKFDDFMTPQQRQLLAG